MAEPRVKSLAKPDEVMKFPLLTVRVVDLGDITVGHFVNEPGWVAGSDLSFEDRGVHTLKGLDGEWRLFRFVTGS